MSSKVKPITNKVERLNVLSALFSRAMLGSMLGEQYGGAREVFKALGYKTDLVYQDFVTQYVRQDIAKAVIDRPVSASWRGGFTVVESKDDKDTKFEEAWKNLDKELQIFSKFTRLDKLAGLGMYGVLFLGLSDISNSEDLSKPVTGVKHKLLYVRPFGEGSATIQEYEADPSNERYGLPKFYQINIENLSTKTYSTLNVHYSRVIHVADGILESEIEGVSRLEAVFNRLKDLEKIVGASAEMFWRGARPGYQGVVDPEYTLTPEAKDDLQDELDEFEHNLRRYLLNEGVKWEALAPQVSDPSKHVDIQLQMISAVTGIPKRILVGSERGELASTQDRDNWFDYVESRRQEFLEPCIIRPFIDRCIELQILPPPKKDDEYSIKWLDLRTPSDEDKANVGKIRTGALKDYASVPAAEGYVPPEAFYRFFLGLDDDQINLIEEMKEAAVKEEEDQAGEEPTPVEGNPEGDFEYPSWGGSEGELPPESSEETPVIQKGWTEAARASAAAKRKRAAEASEVRRLRASNSFKPATKEKQDISRQMEHLVANVVKGKPLKDNEPYDVLAGKHAIEVKTIHDGVHPKITMHPESLSRKISDAKKNGYKPWTVAIDRRGQEPVVYVKEGVGSFRLSSMTRLDSIEKLKGVLK